MTASNVTSRTSCVAPCAIYFDAQTTTSGLTTRPFHELLYQWDFGDPVVGSSGICTDGAPVSRQAGEGSYCTGAQSSALLNSKNYAEGPQAAHVFDNAGTYTVTLTVSQGDTNANGTLDSGEFRRTTVTISVSDPNTIFANNTVCIANGVTPAGGAGGCPSGAYGVNAAAGNAALSTAVSAGCGGNGCRRILFRRGDTFSWPAGVTVTANGPGHIGAYGSGAKPVFNATNGGGIQFSSSSVAQGAMNDWRVTDVKIASASILNSVAIYLGGYINNVLVERVDVTTAQLFQSTSGILSGTSGMWDGIFIFDSTVKGLYQVHGATGQNAIYLTGYRVAAIGNHIDTDRWSEHGIRTYLQRGVISHNTIEDIDSGRAFITMRSFGWPAQNGVPNNTYSGTVVVSQNRTFGGNNTCASGAGPTNQSMDGRTRDVIFERNVIDCSTGGTSALTLVAVQNATMRNNMIFGNGTSGQAFSVMGMDPGVGQSPTNLYYYNNSVFYNAAGFTDLVDILQVPTTGNLMTVQNNLLYNPNDSIDSVLSDPGSAFVITTCSACNTQSNGEKRVSPLFSGSLAALASYFLPSNGSYSNGRGITVPVWNDFYGNWQPGARDIGAINH